MAVYFTADLHLDHHNIIGYCNRPFDNVDTMNASIIERWNDTVTDNDTVWLLGDVAMGHIALSLPLVAQLRGNIILVAGNHDRCWIGHGASADKWLRRYLDVGIGWICSSDRIHLGEHFFNLSHFPAFDISRHDSKYLEFLPPDDGHWLLHGHVHDAWKVNGRQINVGVDVWDFTPVSEQQIIIVVDEENRKLAEQNG